MTVCRQKYRRMDVSHHNPGQPGVGGVRAVWQRVEAGLSRNWEHHCCW